MKMIEEEDEQIQSEIVAFLQQPIDPEMIDAMDASDSVMNPNSLSASMNRILLSQDMRWD